MRFRFFFFGKVRRVQRFRVGVSVFRLGFDMLDGHLGGRHKQAKHLHIFKRRTKKRPNSIRGENHRGRAFPKGSKRV